MIIRTYSELMNLQTFEERFEYLRLAGQVSEETFGFDRWLNQTFYKSSEWKRLRNQIFVRDNGCDLACEDYDIRGQYIIHHMNPLGRTDIVDMTEYVMNPEYLITTTLATHNAIHYGDSSSLPKGPIVRTPNDTCPWKH